jgi:hypothetical protein
MNKSRVGMAGRMLLLCGLAGMLFTSAMAADDTTAGAPAKDVPTNVVDIKPAESSGPAASVSVNPQTIPPEEVVLKNRKIAEQLAREEWFDKVADANPRLVAAVCAHPHAATILAAHKHLAAIADADHLLCRRLTRWSDATEVLLRNADCDRVVQLDPEGIYWAIERRPAYARLLAGHQMFYKMMNDNPDLGRVIAQHMW